MAAIIANGIKMDVIDDGPRNGPVVLLIHGLGWDAARLWAGVVAPLAAAGFRVISPNLRGVGGTETTEVDYTTHLYAQDLEALLDTLGIERAALVGFSMGASIAGAMLSLSDRATSLTLACGGLHSTSEGEAGVEAMLARAETLGAATFAAEQAEAIFHPDWAAAHPDEVADFKTWRAEMNQSALFRAFRSGRGVDLRSTVQGAGLPTQVIAADTDPFCALDDLRAMAASIPDARLDIIENCGHMATIEQRDAFNAALLEFLNATKDPV